MFLRYTIKGDGEARHTDDRVALINKPCIFGGTRPWFQCPYCARQVAVLYMRAGRFACRHCQRVSYASQSGETLDRMWRKQSKLEARLDDHWQRPKGMRHRTYQALPDRLNDCEVRRDAAFIDTAARLFGAAGLAELEKLGR